MMYDGSDPRVRNRPRLGNSSIGASLQSYQKVEVWEKNIEKIKVGCSPEGEKIWDDFLEQVKEDHKDPIQWSRKVS